MPTRELKIQNKAGLHARPAAQIVRLCGKYESEITLSNEEESANGKSLMGLMMLAAGPDSVITALAEGADAEELLNELEALFAARFQEEE